MNDTTTPTPRPPLPLVTAQLVDCLARLENEFARREEHWRNTKADAANIATALMCAMAEAKDAVRVVTDEILKRATP